MSTATATTKRRRKPTKATSELSDAEARDLLTSRLAEVQALLPDVTRAKCIVITPEGSSVRGLSGLEPWFRHECPSFCRIVVVSTDAENLDGAWVWYAMNAWGRLRFYKP